MYQDKVDQLKADIAHAAATSSEELEVYRMKYISKKSVFSQLNSLQSGFPSFPDILTVSDCWQIPSCD